MLTYFLVTVILAALIGIVILTQDVPIPYHDEIILGTGGYDMKGLVAPVATGTILQTLSGTCFNRYIMYAINMIVFSFVEQDSSDPKKVIKR